MKPRFVVSKVSGFAIRPGATGGGRARTLWSVLDSAQLYLPVNERVGYNEHGEQKMRALAAQLNADDEARRG